MDNFFVRYKNALIPLLLAVILTSSLLVINYHVTQESTITATHINIAGRQRMLSQKIAKCILLIHFYTHDKQNISQYKNELREATTLFNDTLIAFSEGGITRNTQGNPIDIDKLGLGNTITNTLNQAKTLWWSLQQNVEVFLTTESVTDDDIADMVEALANHNVELLALMNQLTTLIASEAKTKLTLLQNIQNLIVFFILIALCLSFWNLARTHKIIQHRG